MKLLFFIPVWKRPEITEICFMGINRLRKTGIHQIEAFAVISEEEMKPLCDRYNIDYCFYKNLPLGEKKNYGVSQALKKDFDYLVEIGSDDLLKTEFLNLYPWDRHIMGLQNAVILNSKTGSCRMVGGKLARFGAGRAISKEALSIAKPWNDEISRRLDNNSAFRFASLGFMEHRYYSKEPLLIDIKSDVNIWGYSATGRKKYSLEKALEGLSEQETDAINSLIHVAV